MSGSACSLVAVAKAAVSSLELRTSRDCNLIPNAGAATCASLNLSVIPGLSGSRIKATRVTLGNISLSSSSRFPVNSGDICDNPVIAAGSCEAGD